MPFSGHQFKIYSFKPGSLPASRVRTARSKAKADFWGRGGTGWVHNKPSRIRDFWWYLSSSCRSCLLFLLYMEYRVCKTASAKLKKSLSKCQNLGWWTGSFLWLWEFFEVTFAGGWSFIRRGREELSSADRVLRSAWKRCKSIIQNISRWGGMAGWKRNLPPDKSAAAHTDGRSSIYLWWGRTDGWF